MISVVPVIGVVLVVWLKYAIEKHLTLISLFTTQVDHQAGAYPGFCSMSTPPWMGC